MPYYTSDDGCRIFYTDEGTGLPVLCLSGLTRNHRDFDHVVPHLAEARVIRMDYRGRGQSDWPGPESYTIPQEAADAIALLDHLGIDKAAILGTSRGGLIAMLMGVANKDRLLGVALNDIGPEIADEGMSEIVSYLGCNPTARTVEEFLPRRAKTLTGFHDVPQERWRHDIAANYIQTSEGLQNRYDNRLRDAVLSGGATPQPDLWPLFDTLEGLPLALIRGMNSTLLSVETTAEMRRRRPDMIFAEVADRGHVPFLDEPEAVAALHAWLETMT